MELVAKSSELWVSDDKGRGPWLSFPFLYTSVDNSGLHCGWVSAWHHLNIRVFLSVRCADWSQAFHDSCLEVCVPLGDWSREAGTSDRKNRSVFQPCPGWTFMWRWNASLVLCRSARYSGHWSLDVIGHVIFVWFSSRRVFAKHQTTKH